MSAGEISSDFLYFFVDIRAVCQDLRDSGGNAADGIKEGLGIRFDSFRLGSSQKEEGDFILRGRILINLSGKELSGTIFIDRDSFNAVHNFSGPHVD